MWVGKGVVEGVTGTGKEYIPDETVRSVSQQLQQTCMAAHALAGEGLSEQLGDKLEHHTLFEVLCQVCVLANHLQQWATEAMSCHRTTLTTERKKVYSLQRMSMKKEIATPRQNVRLLL